MNANFGYRNNICDSVPPGSKRDPATGFIVGEVLGTRTGVFPYPDPDGGPGLVGVCRHPDDVFEQASLDSASMRPVTNDHPELRYLADGRTPDPAADGFVNSDNAHRLAKGSLGNTHRVDADGVYFPYSVTHADTVAEVEAGKRGLSMGYKAVLVKESGEFRGVPYQYRQKKIRYNHMAIVDQGRVGHTARIHLDSAIALDGKQPPEKKGKRMKQVFLDIAGSGTKLPYEVADEVAAFLDAQTAKAEKATADLATMTTARDTAQGKADTLQTELDTANETIKNLPATLKGQLQLRAAIEKKASGWMDAAEIAKHVALSDADFIKIAVAAKKPAMVLDGKSADYIQAVFDTLTTKASTMQDGGEGEDEDLEDEDGEDEINLDTAGSQREQANGGRGQGRRHAVVQDADEDGRGGFRKRMTGKGKGKDKGAED